MVVVQKRNRAELKDLIVLAANIGFTRITLSTIVTDFTSEELGETIQNLQASEAFTEEFGHELMSTGKECGIEVTFWITDQRYSPDFPCEWLWQRVFIAVDGNIVPCCRISDPALCTMGTSADFAGCWNGTRYMTWRKQHLAQRYPEGCEFCYGKSSK